LSGNEDGSSDSQDTSDNGRPDDALTDGAPTESPVDDTVELPTSPVAATTCGGQPATIFGTSASETVRGTSAPDVIVALRGNDKIFGAQGNDVICAGPGNDTAQGGPGNDRLAGELGSDNLLGGLDTNQLEGGPFNACSEQFPCNNQPFPGWRPSDRDYCALIPVHPTSRTLCDNPADYWFDPDRTVPPRWLVLRANRFNECGPWPGGC
jgi:Ca2+-binding RTX toxin-like protein